jgi:hypothetical protein
MHITLAGERCGRCVAYFIRIKKPFDNKIIGKLIIFLEPAGNIFRNSKIRFFTTLLPLDNIPMQ